MNTYTLNNYLVISVQLTDPTLIEEKHTECHITSKVRSRLPTLVDRGAPWERGEALSPWNL